MMNPLPPFPHQWVERVAHEVHIKKSIPYCQIPGFLNYIGLNVNTQDESGATLLHFATYYNDPYFVHILLFEGANPLLPNNYGAPPISFINPENSGVDLKFAYAEWAIAYHINAYVPQILHQTGLDNTSVDSSGNTLLHYAMWYNNASFMHSLLEAGADLFAKNNIEICPLFLIINNPYLEVISELNEYFNKYPEDWNQLNQYWQEILLKYISINIDTSYSTEIDILGESTKEVFATFET